MIKCKPLKIHQKEVSLLQNQMRARKERVALNRDHAPSNTLRNSDFKKNIETFDIAHLNQVLNVDLRKKLVTVEPKITIKKLTQLLLKQNLMLAVVPEFGSITVGGAIIGTSLESSSHRYGQFNDLCTCYELILGDGSLIQATHQENSDLFYGIAGSYGTLALMTAVTMKIIEAKKYVRLTYKRFWNYHHLIEHLSKPSQYDFIDGVLFSKSWGVALEGTLIHRPNGLPLNKQGKFYKPWFYQHLTYVTENGSFEEVLPLEDYLFRFDQGAFWMGRFVGKLRLMLRMLFHLKPATLPNAIYKKSKATEGPSLWFRSLFAPFLSSKKLYKIWHKVPNSISESLFFIQDFYTPVSQTETLLKKCMDATHIYPIWLCPIKNTTQGQFLSPHYHEERMINIGLYGIPKTNIPIPILTNALEKEIYKGGGKKMLYSYTYYDKTLFSKIYDLKSYDKLRSKYKATEAFLHLQEKILH
jgi:hypothetical protein